MLIFSFRSYRLLVICFMLVLGEMVFGMFFRYRGLGIDDNIIILFGGLLKLGEILFRGSFWLN